MNDVNFGHRSPLVATFRDKKTSTEFTVVLNHLARGNVDRRQQQAMGLRLWVEDQMLPVIGIGDFNFDYDFKTQKGNAGFDEFLIDGHWRWLQPDPLVESTGLLAMAMAKTTIPTAASTSRSSAARLVIGRHRRRSSFVSMTFLTTVGRAIIGRFRLTQNPRWPRMPKMLENKGGRRF
jgi:hypothetical protein